jgi:signal transduction histidine kinase/sugar phosphate isomerase/epimerase
MLEIALSSWSLHSLFLNPEISGMKGIDFPRVARECFGVRHIEFYEGDYAPTLVAEGFQDTDYAREVHDQCEAHGVEVVCMAAVNDLTAADPAARDRDRRRILQLASLCAILHCPIIRINSGREKLDDERAERLAQELQRVSDELAGSNVKLAVENHPHVLLSDQDTDLLVRAIEGINRSNVGFCPDVGAMGPRYWLDGFKRMAPRAFHVHLKPYVMNGLPEDPDAKWSISQYLPVVRDLLLERGYEGALALESLPSQNLLADPHQHTLELLQQTALVMGTPWERPASPSSCDLRLHRLHKPNQDKELAPSKVILQLLADGCERRLGAQIRIHDLATEQVVFSETAAHRFTPESPPPGPGFCALVDEEPRAADECKRFYAQKLSLIKDGKQDKPRICICPMGLMILSVPIMDETQVYGAISCGPWVEQGTEGMIFDGILRHVAPASQPALEKASLGIIAYAPAKLIGTTNLVNGLAQELSGIYEERFQARRFLKEGSRLIQQLQTKSGDSTPPRPETFVTTLEEIFHEFEQVAGFGRLALYQRRFRPDQSDEFRLQSPSLPESRGDLPEVVSLEGMPHARSPYEFGEQLFREITRRTPYECLGRERRETDEYIIFCYPPNSKISSDFKNFFNQFATEVYYILANMRNLREADDRRVELVLFTNRFKHAISSALQGISDRVLQFKRYLKGRRTMTFENLGELVHDLDDFSIEAGSVLDRFTGLVRVSGQHGRLRPQHIFSMINVNRTLGEAIRQWLRAAEKRSIRIRGPELGREIYQEGDPDALAEVFGNLVENALKFAKDGEFIDVSVADSHSRMTPPWQLGRPGRRFVVRDRGLGIAEDEIERIFRPFEQGRAFSATRVIPGTGLGLAICKQIVEAHGGKITIQSRPVARSDQRQEIENLQDCVVEVIVDLPLKVQTDHLASREGL